MDSHEAYSKAVFAATVLDNPWLKSKPTERQAEFLAFLGREAMYGGSAGGGKSIALLMAALQFVDVPNYAAIIFRRTYADLSLPGALMDRAREWLSHTRARWSDKEKTWHFPSGATLTFGYLDTANDRYRYQSSEFQFIGFDELTQFSEEDYRYLFSRMRRVQTSQVPLRMRVASNPGGAGHDWVKQRFMVEGAAAGRAFIPAKLDDNPHLDREAYVGSLSQLDPITRAQLLAGDWSARQGGSIFKREWFRIIDVAPPALQLVRSWDLAATEQRKGNDPDWTVGTKLGRDRDGVFYIVNVKRVRATPQHVEKLIVDTAKEDGRTVPIFMEQEPGSAGVALIHRYVNLLAGWPFRGIRSTGDKVTRAAPFSSQAEAGRVVLVRGPWNGAWLDEVEAFPNGSHDDVVDSVSLGFGELTGPYSAASSRPPRLAVHGFGGAMLPVLGGGFGNIGYDG